MNVDELKLILDTVQTVSGDAKLVVITWFAIGALESAMWAGVVAFCIWTFANTARVFSQSTDTVAQINAMLGRPGSNYVEYSHEHQAVIDAVRELKDKNHD